LTFGLGVEADVQLSAFTWEETPGASPATVVLNEEIFAAKHVEDIACGKELADQMLTKIESMLVFTETDLDTR
jgi:hypothetical protein